MLVFGKHGSACLGRSIGPSGEVFYVGLMIVVTTSMGAFGLVRILGR